MPLELSAALIKSPSKQKELVDEFMENPRDNNTLLSNGDEISNKFNKNSALEENIKKAPQANQNNVNSYTESLDYTEEYNNGYNHYMTLCSLCHGADVSKNKDNILVAINEQIARSAIQDNKGGKKYLNFISSQHLQEISYYIKAFVN